MNQETANAAAPRKELKNIRSPHKGWKPVMWAEIDGVECRLTHRSDGRELSVAFREQHVDNWSNYVISVPQLVARYHEQFLADLAALRVPFEGEEVSVRTEVPPLDSVTLRVAESDG